MEAEKAGSPPQVRGKRLDGTPIKQENEDHPRRCGENFIDIRCAVVRAGSPPQVRGKQNCDHGRSDARWDHPRRCGENKYILLNSC